MNLHRKDFLKFLAASAADAALPRSAAAAPSKTEAFAERLMEDWATALRGALGYIGDRLGIFKAMASAGPVTADELARKTKLNPRMLGEWLNAMAAASYVEYRPAGKAYFLPPERWISGADLRRSRTLVLSIS